MRKFVGRATWIATSALIAILILESFGRINFTSDQAIVGLMAHDILEDGVHPVFCYGSAYGGTLEAHLIAVVLAFLGPSVLAFRVVTVSFALASAVLIDALSRRVSGSEAQIAGGLAVVLAPHFYYYKVLTSDGDYATVLLSASVFALTVVMIEERFRQGRPTGTLTLGAGLVAGLGWWSHPTSIALLVAWAAAVVFNRSWHWLKPRTLALLAGGFLIGSGPWWISNLRWNWKSLAAPENDLLGWSELPARLSGLAGEALPILVGGGTVWTWESSTWRIAAALALFCWVLGGAVRYPAPEPDRRFGRSLLVALVVAPFLLAVLVARTDLREPRYLLVAYVGLFALFGVLYSNLSSRGSRIALASLGLVLGLGSWLYAPHLRGIEGGVYEDIDGIVEDLQRRGVRHVYASYWTAYRLSFLSNNEILATPFGAWGHSSFRHVGLRRSVDGSDRPYFLLSGYDRGAMDRFISKRGLVVDTAEVGAYRLFGPLPSELAAIVRQRHMVPSTVNPGDLQWSSVGGPRVVSTGQEVTYQIGFRWLPSNTLSNNVRLSYHWLTTSGDTVVFDGLRTELPAQRQPDFSVAATVRANLPPGHYLLQFDLVDEGWAWFEKLGAAASTVEVEVRQ